MSSESPFEKAPIPLHRNRNRLVKFAWDRKGAARTVEKILRTVGVDPNARTSHRRTALHLAAEFDRNAAIAVMLKPEFKMDVDAVNKRGQTALEIAAAGGNTACVEQLLAAGARVNYYKAFHVANEWTQFTFLRYGADVNMPDDDGNTALVKAARRGYIYAIRVFLQSGADVDLPGGTGETALCIAVRNNNEIIMRCLIAVGANVDATTRDGTPLLTLALHASSLTVIKLLVLAGATCDDYARSEIQIRFGQFPTEESIALFRRIVTGELFQLVKHRACCILIGMAGWDLPMPLSIAVLDYSCRFAYELPYHVKWNMVFKVRHFHDRRRSSPNE